MSSQRISKVQSVIRQIVASQFIVRVADAARMTVTSVEVTPDMRQAIVWISVIADTEEMQLELFKQVQREQKGIQAAVAGQMATRFVPRLDFRLDTGGEHAQNISRLIKGL